MLRKSFLCNQWISIFFLLMTIITFADLACAAGEEDLFVNVQPNVLFIFDNSNSMDQSTVGDANGSWHPSSRSVMGRKALQNITNAWVNQMRIGLMTYRLPSASKYQLHATNYFVSYEPKSYCPSDNKVILDACQNYCRTGDAASQATCQTGCSALNPAFDATYRDSIITNYGTGSEQRSRYCNLIYPKTHRINNLSNPGSYIYYKTPGTFYAGGNYGNQYCNFNVYSPNEGAPWDSYRCYYNKTDASDGSTNYTGAGMSGTFSPTDEDFALGFYDYGRRMQWYYSGQTWYANSSPGGGFLHRGCDNNDSVTNLQKNALLAKLATKESDQAGYMVCTDTGNPNNCAYIVNAGLTPMAGSFRSAYNYFKGEADYRSGVSYTSPIQDYCQKNFIVYVTDGLPSVNETGTAGTAASLIDGVKTRIENLRMLKKTISGKEYDFDIQTYVIGVALTEDAQPYLDSMAEKGGTAVSGKAYYANNLDELNTALAKVFESISSKAFSFSTASVSASRVKDENFLYEASFLPAPLNTLEPFWLGYLKQFKILDDGTIDSSAVWDAGAVLQNTSASSRSIWTWKGGAATVFKTPTDGGSITSTDLDVTTDVQRDAVVNFIRGGELDSTYKYAGWKLGDIFHSSPKTIGTPSNDYTDQVDTQNPRAYENFRSSHIRTTVAGNRIIVVGANDGQMHAFRTKDGAEQWSFIPPSLLPKLKNIVHTTHSPLPSGLSHAYYVDGPISASDVYLPSIANDGTTKLSNDWYTYMVFGLRQGGTTTLWSSSSSCDSDFSATYSGTRPYYCGYYALNITDTLSPYYKWVIGGTTGLSSADGSYFGQPWSRMAIGRVKYGGNETWVGFVGGGYSGEKYGSPSYNVKGKGFYLVNMATGQILWRFTHSNLSSMEYDLAGPPAVVDSDNDGFIDTAYMADLGGNVWRFKFCLKSEGACTWSGGKFFDSSAGVMRPIYTSPSIAKDKTGNLWVYFGTGDVTNPTGTGVQEKFFAVKDNDRSSTWNINNLKDITSSTYNPYEATKNGWYFNFVTNEKVLADPTVFRGVLYFTTYLPASSVGLCDKSGTAYLYAVDYVTGAGKYESDARSTKIGTGLATNVIVSLNPYGGTDVYASTSSVEEGEAHTKKQKTPDIANLNKTNLLFWRDMRVD